MKTCCAKTMMLDNVIRQWYLLQSIATSSVFGVRCHCCRHRYPIVVAISTHHVCCDTNINKFLFRYFDIYPIHIIIGVAWYEVQGHCKLQHTIIYQTKSNRHTFTLSVTVEMCLLLYLFIMYINIYFKY